ncbi:MAG: T9SS type A sorting domain-containing protein, partial [Bacteroidetes bacterium]|nr:T9SS type A sorting domain-containing protein [Bacteroidota bacterium]
TNSISVRKNCNGSGCDISPVSTYSWTVDPTSVAGTASSTQVICAGSAPSNMTLSGYTGSIQWQSSPDNSTWTNITGANATPLTAAQMGGTLSATTYYRTVVTSGACTAANSNVVVVYTNDADASGTIASSTSSRMCIVNDNNWHYFRNTSGEVIAAINSQGEDLGNVTMEVTIQTTPHHGTYLSEAHGDGGLGHNGDCQVLPELSVRRWYTIEPEWQNYQNGNTSKPTLIRLFLDPSDYLNYRSEIATWHSVLGNNAPNSYIFCYGTTNSIIDLAVSRNKLKDVPVTLATSNGGPGGVAQYQLSRDSLSTYRFHTNGGIGGPLPIELLSFTGYNDGAVNQLNWTTGSEVNTNQFEIQRSLDGITWETIGSVTARGAQMVSTDYNFEDANPTQGDNYYRLKIIDNDASFEYSSIIRIKVNGTTAINAITQVFPNPTTGKLNVWVAATEDQNVIFNVSDAIGKKVAELSRSLVGGVNKLEFNFDNLASGTYIISYVDVNGNKHYHKFVKD